MYELEIVARVKKAIIADGRFEVGLPDLGHEALMRRCARPAARWSAQVLDQHQVAAGAVDL
jgi:hypothetical protein